MGQSFNARFLVQLFRSLPLENISVRAGVINPGYEVDVYSIIAV